MNKTITTGCLVLLLFSLAGCTRRPHSDKPDEIVYDTIPWSKLPDLPGISDTLSLGVSAPFAGISNGTLLVAGGCNFPDKPAAEGGAKKYYSDIFALDLSNPSAEWKKAGNLPHPVAYGASATTPKGVICIGGNNDQRSLADVYLLSWNEAKQSADITKLPPIPSPMDNFSAACIDSTVYIAGGNNNGQPCHTCMSMKMAEKSDTTANRWEILPDFPGPARLQPVLSAQRSADGIRIYLAGGFQPIQGYTGLHSKPSEYIPCKPAVVSTDMLSYHPATQTWTVETEFPKISGSLCRTATGGCAVAFGDSSILWMGGVNHLTFMLAINRPERMQRADAYGDWEGVEYLEKEAKEYMHHPVEWYRFNTALLQYNTFTKEWTSLGEYQQLARAGAGAVLTGDTLIIINGELKPGVRTPEVNYALLKE